MKNISVADYRDRLKAAFLSRAAGCTLGVPVEGWTNSEIENYAAELGLTCPLDDYWTECKTPDVLRYGRDTYDKYLKGNITYLPCDDDIGYTLLSLFTAEEGGGTDFTLDNVAAAWLKYVNIACTAEDVAIKNLRNGVAPEKAAEIDNEYDEWIGADIRCDGYGYMAPCNPEKAAKMAYTDAYISHRNNGIYGSMYFAAVISIAFGVDDAKEALVQGLDHIPSDCELSEAIKWALSLYDEVRDYNHACTLVDEKFPEMSRVHTINNACLTIFGLALGGRDIGRVISETVHMGYDCDCTAATAGSIAGACYGMKALAPQWYEPFGDVVSSYFYGEKEYKISDILARFERLAVTNGNIV